MILSAHSIKGVIIESFGIGGIPNVDEDIVSKIHELIEAGSQLSLQRNAFTRELT